MMGQAPAPEMFTIPLSATPFALILECSLTSWAPRQPHAAPAHSVPDLPLFRAESSNAFGNSNPLKSGELGTIPEERWAHYKP